MQTVEITAKSVDEAKQAAAKKLGVAAEQISVTILEETKGLFGKSNVRVRAEVGAVAPAEAAKSIEPEPVVDKPKRSRSAKPPAKEQPTEPLEEIQVAMDAPPPVEVKKSTRRGKPATTEETAPAPSNEDAPTEEVVATAEDGDRLVDLVRDLLDSARLQVNARVGEVSGRYVSIVLDGRDAAFLVGKHGEVLNALQYLVNVIGSRKIANGVRATLDCNDYRRRREEALTGLATKIAEEVRQRGEEAVLDALPAFERRVVHKALSELEGVTTYSEGEEPNRRVVIAPAE